MRVGGGSNSRIQTRPLAVAGLIPSTIDSKGSRHCRFADHPTVSVTPVHSLVAIARNGWSRSIGTNGRNQPVRPLIPPCAGHIVMRSGVRRECADWGGAQEYLATVATPPVVTLSLSLSAS